MSRAKYPNELLLRIDRGSTDTYRNQVATQIKQAIEDRRLSAGARLPPSRTLAEDLGVSRGVVTDAYSQLAAEGFIVQRSGGGTRVTGMLPPARVILSDQPHESPRFDLVGTVPDLSLFPRRAWSAALRQAIREMPDSSFGYSDPRGRTDLRDQLADYLKRVRGLAARREHLLVTNGYTQGLALTLRVLRGRGAKRLAIENPSDPDQWETISRMGLEVVPVPVTSEGIDVDVLEESGADAVLLTPAHQFPMGVPLTPDRRRRIIAWAASRGATIIEDDYDSAYRYDRSAVGTLQQLAPEYVVHIGSVSKLLAPALRMGWVVAPADLVEPLANDRWAMDAGQNGIDQAAFALFLSKGELDRHIRRCRAEYSQRWKRLTAAIKLQLPEAKIEGIAAGLHMLLRLPPPASAPVITQALRAQGIKLQPLEGYLVAPDPRQGPAIVIGFGRLLPSRIESVVIKIAAAVRENHY